MTADPEVQNIFSLEGSGGGGGGTVQEWETFLKGYGGGGA